MKLFEKVWQVAKVEVQSGEPNLHSLISAVLVEILCALNKISHETSVVNSSDLVKDLENVVSSLITFVAPNSITHNNEHCYSICSRN